MRHRKKVKKIGRTPGHRHSTLRNLASGLIEHHQIRTTLAKAKALQQYVERLISYAKENSVHSRRLVFKFLQNRSLVKKLFDEIVTQFEGRNGGFTRVVKLGQRQGDGAMMSIVQLVGFEQVIMEEEAEKKKRRQQRAEKKKAAEEARAKAAEEAEESPKAEEAAAEETTEPAEEPKKKKAKSAGKKSEEKTSAAEAEQKKKKTAKKPKEKDSSKGKKP